MTANVMELCWPPLLYFVSHMVLVNTYLTNSYVLHQRITAFLTKQAANQNELAKASLEFNTKTLK